MAKTSPNGVPATSPGLTDFAIRHSQFAIHDSAA
jgi:hypothetical protein